VVGQLELGHETGIHHWQIYMELKTPFGLSSWKEFLMCDWAHIEKRNGTQAQAIAYVCKEDTRVNGPETSEYPINQPLHTVD